MRGMGGTGKRRNAAQQATRKTQRAAAAAAACMQLSCTPAALPCLQEGHGGTGARWAPRLHGAQRSGAGAVRVRTLPPPA